MMQIRGKSRAADEEQAGCKPKDAEPGIPDEEEVECKSKGAESGTPDEERA